MSILEEHLDNIARWLEHTVRANDTIYSYYAYDVSAERTRRFNVIDHDISNNIERYYKSSQEKINRVSSFPQLLVFLFLEP